MTLLYYDPLFLEHQTGSHPEHRGRLEHIWRRLEGSGLAARCQRPTWAPATDAVLRRVHSPAYLSALAAFVAAGGGAIEADTVCGLRSLDAARLAAGAACDAVRRVTEGRDRRALCVVRPPGHHALPGGAMGFCLLGNVALAAGAAIDELGLERVLIVDWDVHHGNGTQDVFWRDPRVAFLSIHRWPFYPGTGRADETGGGDALGTKLNLPIEYGTTRRAYLDAFRSGLDALCSRIRPQLILVSAGFDALRNDPIGSLNLEVEDFATLTRETLAAAEAWADGRLVSVLEGGYDPRALAECVAAHLTVLLDDPPAPG